MKYTIFVLLIFFGTIPTLKADVKKWKLEQVGFLNIDRNEEDRKMGCWIILSALVNVCPEAAESLPHLYQQFESWSPY